MKKWKGLIFLCCVLLASTLFVGCFGSSNSDGSGNESGVPNEKITVTFDPCMEDYEGLKTNTPLTQKLEKGDFVKEPTVRALENPNNYTCEGWYTSKDYTTKWNFKTDKAQESMTLYAKWVQSCEVKYYLTDGETGELKRTVSVAKNGLAQKLDTLAQGYELLGYYKDEALTEEFDFSAPIIGETNVYIKRSPYIYLDAKFIAENFKGVASNAGKNGATFGGIEYVEEEDCVEVNFGYCPDLLDSHIIMENFPLVINKSQKIEVTMKMPEGNAPLGAMVIYVTSLYEDKSIAVFPGANEEMSANVNLKQMDDEGWVTATIDLGEKLYGGASIWANSTYLGLMRVQLQYAYHSEDLNDTHSIYIKSIKGVADDTYVGAEDTFESDFLENDSDEILDNAVSTVQNGFSFPADREEVKGSVVNGTAYNKEEGLLVYMPYRTPYNEINLQPKEGKTISLDENKVMKIRVKNLGYIPYLEFKFENTNGYSSTTIEVKVPSQMTEFETFNVDLSEVVGLSGNLKNVKIAANSKGVDNAYIIESIEFVEYIIEPVTGFDFSEVQNTDSLTNEYSSQYGMLIFDVKENGASFSKEYTQYAIDGYDTLTLGYVNPDGGITKVNVTLTVDDCDYTYVYDVAVCDSLTPITKSLESRGNVSKMTVSFEGTGTIYLDSLSLGFETGIDLTDKKTVEKYLSIESWLKGMYDATEGAARINLPEAPAMFYLADAGFKNIEIGDNNKLYLIYQNRGTGNQPLTILLYGTDTVDGIINFGNSKVYYFDSVKNMTAGQWAKVEIDLSDFAWDYINLVKIQNVEGSSEELYVRAVTLAKVETTVEPDPDTPVNPDPDTPVEPETPVNAFDFTVKENAQLYLDNAWVKGAYDEEEGALKADLAQSAAMFYLAPAGKNNLEIGENTKLVITYQIRGEKTNQPIIITVFGGDSVTDAAWDSKNGGEFWKDVQRSMVSGQWATLEIDLTSFEYEYISVVKLQGDGATAGEIYIKGITLEELENETPVEPDPDTPVEPDPDTPVEPETPVNGLDFTVKENAQFYLDNTWVKGAYDEEEGALKADLAQSAAMFYLAPAGKNNLEIGENTKLVITYQIRGEKTNQPIIITVFGGDSVTDVAWDSKNGGEFWKDVQRSMVSGQWATLEIDLTSFEYEYISVVKLQGDGATAGEIYIKGITLEKSENETPVEPDPDTPVNPDPDTPVEPETPVNAFDFTVKENAQLYLDNAWVKGAYDEEEGALKADLAQSAAMFYLAPAGKNNLEIGNATRLEITYKNNGNVNNPLIISVSGGNSATDAAWDSQFIVKDKWINTDVSGNWATITVDVSSTSYTHISCVKLDGINSGTGGEMWIKSVALVYDEEVWIPETKIDLSNEELANTYLNNAWVKGAYDEEEGALKADLAQSAAMFYLAPAGKNNLEIGENTKLVITYQIRGELTNQPIVVTVFGGDSVTDAAWDSKNGGEFWKDVQRSMVSGQWATLEIDLTNFEYEYISVIKLQAGEVATAGEIYIKEIKLA